MVTRRLAELRRWQLYGCGLLLKCVSLFPKQRWWWWGKGLHVRVTDWVWTELLHTLCIKPRLKLHLGGKREQANAQESSWHRKKEWATVCVCVCVWHCTHTFHLFHLVNFLFYPLSCSISVFLGFFGDSILFYGNSYCSTNSVMCIYCSICEIGGTGRQAHYYSITGAGRFHSRGLSQAQTEALPSVRQFAI